MAADKPLPVTAASSPMALAMTTRVLNSTLRPAAPKVIQPVKSISPLASKAALSILIHPRATTVTIATVMTVAATALSVR